MHSPESELRAIATRTFASITHLLKMWVKMSVGTRGGRGTIEAGVAPMIRKLASGKYRLYSRKKDPKTGRRRNLGTFASLQAAQRHERAVQYFKRRG